MTVAGCLESDRPPRPLIRRRRHYAARASASRYSERRKWTALQWLVAAPVWEPRRSHGTGARRNRVGTTMDDAAKISVAIPVYNEAGTIGEVIRRVLYCGFETEVIVVDDASTDDTPGYLRSLEHPQVHCFYHAVNRGKGAALRTGFAAARNPYVVVQDADLEYDPRDYRHLLEALLDGRADMVYGSRFLGGPHRVLFFWHYMGNRMLTLVADMMCNLNLTDMETGMKII